MTNDQIREETIELMTGFMRDHLYMGQEISDQDLLDTAAIYYDIVKGMEEAVIEEETRRASIAAGIAAGESTAPSHLIDASSPSQVDLMGGAEAINRSASDKGI
jgi:hypothetical protein